MLESKKNLGRPAALRRRPSFTLRIRLSTVTFNFPSWRVFSGLLTHRTRNLLFASGIGSFCKGAANPQLRPLAEINMRRNDKEISDFAEIEAILQSATICRIGMLGQQYPYIVPVNFGYFQKEIFCHSANQGLKLDLIKANPNVCLEIDTAVEIVKNEKACNWGTKYRSVIGFGKAIVIEEYEEKIIGLNAIMKKYSTGIEYQFDRKEVANIAIIKIKIESITGKQSGYNQR